MNKIHLKSIKQALAYLSNSQEHLFYIGRIYCNSTLDLHSFMPHFEIIACFDPFNNRFPFVTVPESFKNHKCTTATECQALILKDPETISYIKSKAANPNVFFMMIDSECQRLCIQNQLNMWGPTYQTYSLLGNKVKIIDLLKQVNIPFIPNLCSKIHSYSHFLEITKPLNTTNIVVQTQYGVSGMGTFNIFNQQRYNMYSSLFQSGVMNKIMPFKKLKSFGISAVASRFGTVIGPIHAEVIGHPKLTPYNLGFCANEQRNDYFQDKQIQMKVRHKMFDITKRFGDYLYSKGIFRGMFGIDFVVDLQSYQVYFMEINPRLTGSTTISYQFYQAQGQQFPIILYHCLEFMDVSLDLDLQAFNREWEELTYYDPPATHLSIKPFSEAQRNIKFSIPAGLWTIREGQLKYTGKFTYKVKQMDDDQFFLLPNRGFSKANLILKKRCQDYNCRLTDQVQEIIDKVLQLIAQEMLSSLINQAI